MDVDFQAWQQDLDIRVKSKFPGSPLASTRLAAKFAAESLAGVGFSIWRLNA